jgi:hypothetical protein
MSSDASLAPTVARRLLAMVPYADRLRAGRFRPPVGLIRNDVRSLPELEHLLAPEPSSLPGLDIARAADWVERVLGDAALADEIRCRAATEGSYVDRCLALHAVVARRVAEARAAVSAAEPNAEGEV